MHTQVTPMNRLLLPLAALVVLLAGPNVASASTTIWAVGDGAAAGPTDDQVGQMIGAQAFDYFFYLGDVYETGSAADFANYYDPVYGGYKAKTRPTPGNHEWGARATGYDAYWGPAYSSPHYYSFDSGGWHIISLNSEESSAVGSAQRAWLEADIAEHPGTCTLAFWHKPRYAVASRTPSGSPLGGDSSTAGLWDPLEGSASVALTAHLHNYQRLDPIDGITSIMVGTGGKGAQHHTFTQPPPASNPDSAYLNDTDFGALKLVLDHRRADFSFVDLAGTVKDSGRVACELPPVATTNGAGDVDSDSATVAASVNPEGPETSYRFEYGPTDAYGSSTPNLGAGSGGGERAVSARLNGLVDETTYYYRVVASNRHGTTYGTPQTLRTMPLDTTLDAAPATPSNDPSPRFGFSSTEPAAAFECSIDQGSDSFAPCSGPGSSHVPAAPLADGAYVFRVRAVDQAGNRDRTPATHDFTVDTQAPAVAVLSGPTGAAADPAPRFEFTSEPGAFVQCSIDREAPNFGPCSGPPASHGPASSLPDGPYSFRVRASDAVGNTALATRTFIVDTKAPETTIGGDRRRRGAKRKVTIGFFSSEPAGRFECSVDRKRFKACTSPRPYRASAVGPGGHTLLVRAIDAAGNVDSSPAKSRFKLKR